MDKTNKLSIQLPANGNYSTLNSIQDGILKTINLLTRYDEVDQKRVFASLNGLSSILLAINITKDKNNIEIEGFDNPELRDWMFIWLTDAIELIGVSEAMKHDPKTCSIAIATISTLLRGMNPYKQTVRLAS